MSWITSALAACNTTTTVPCRRKAVRTALSAYFAIGFSFVGAEVPWYERTARAAPHRGETSVRDQVHIRNAEAAQLARALARQTGKTISEIVLDALRQYRPRPHSLERGNRVELWHQLLRRDRARLTRPEVPIESFYNKDTGLPE